MKVKVNIRDHLEHYAENTNHLLIHTSVDLDDLFETNSMPEEQEFDIFDLLAENHAIALVWDTEQIRSHYGHLTEEQAWEVLKQCERDYDAEHGLCWDDISEVVNERFPDAPEAKQRLLDQLHSLQRQVEALPADERTNPAIYGEIAAGIDTLETTLHEKGA